MASILEPTHYLRFCGSRELSDDEIQAVADTIYDHIGDLITDDEVIAHENDLGQFCYIFTLDDDLVTADDGTFVGDAMSEDLMDLLPEDLDWALEASLPDQEIEVADTATEAQIQEAAIQQVRTLLKG